VQLGDARSGRLAGNLSAFGRALRRAGVPVDASRIALAQQAALLIDIGQREDLAAALETVLVGREQDRAVFRELFDAFFRDPKMAHKLLAQLLPTAEGRAEPDRRRARVRDALQAPKPAQPLAQPKGKDREFEFDATMTASDLQRLRHADFNSLSADEYALVERLARDIALPLPELPSRRTRPGWRGARPHWPGVMQRAARHGGEVLELPRLQRRSIALPLMVLVDVSGSMERYARLLLAFLHAATRGQRRRDVMAFGMDLTDLRSAFALSDTDAMLAQTNALIADFACGTRLGQSLLQLRQQHARRLIGRRTVVLLITDGLDTGEPELLKEQLQWLRLHSRRLLWLNPLMRFDGYAPLARGAAVLHAQADAMLAVHNLSRLKDLADNLARLLRS
jgi:uncharacterized protein with von Willebrand factor type A (vWA) domain